MKLKKIRIKSIKEGSIKPLYDFEVPDVHHYFANKILSSNSVKKLALQTIPRVKEMRNIICAPPGWKLVEFDLSQIELRLMAWYSQDPIMLKEYKNKVDIHLETLKFMLRRVGLDPEIEIPKFKENGTFKERRKRAKLFNFGGGYGGGKKTLASSINEKLQEGEPHVSEEDAQAHLDFFFNKYHRLHEYYEEVEKVAFKNKQVISCFNRIRRLPALNLPNTKENQYVIQEAYRHAKNSVIQGTAADITKFAMIEVYEELQKRNMKSIVSFDVHDAMFSLVPDNEVYEYCMITKAAMQKERPPIMRESIEIIAEGSVSQNWGNSFNDEKLKQFNLTTKILEE